jgi:hypothetical protein
VEAVTERAEENRQQLPCPECGIVIDEEARSCRRCRWVVDKDVLHYRADTLEIDSGHCAICDGPQDLSVEKPGYWLKCRGFCSQHGEPTLPTGEGVYSFLDRWKEDCPLEGAGLNPVINPVVIEGRRAWMNFFMVPTVWEEIFPSRDFFEYSVQHDWGFLDRLYVLHQARHRGLRQLNRTVSRMCDYWKEEQILRFTLKKLGKAFPESPEEAVELARPANDLLLEYRWIFGGMLERTLLEIAERRFAHLNG